MQFSMSYLSYLIPLYNSFYNVKTVTLYEYASKPLKLSFSFHIQSCKMATTNNVKICIFAIQNEIVLCNPT